MYRQMELTKLVESKTNQRKSFDRAKLQELAESIRSKGILEPLLVRKKGKKYEVVAGARRFRAAKLANIDHKKVPVIIRELNDLEAIEIQVIENLQREDLTAIEEADGYRQLMKIGASTVFDVASKIGKSTEYVYGRLQLGKLVPQARKKIEDGTITASHGVLLAKLTPQDQARLMEEIVITEEWDYGTSQSISVKSLDAHIQQEITRRLAAAPFKQDDAKLDRKAGACTKCPFRQESKEGAVCTKSSCYESKWMLALEDKAKTLLEEGAQHVFVRLDGDRTNMELSNTLEPHQYSLVKKKKPCKYAIKGVVAVGKKVGQLVDVCIDPGCTKHRASSSASSGRRNLTPAQVYKRRQELRKEKIATETRRATIREVYRLALKKKATVDVVKQVAETLWSRAHWDGQQQWCMALQLEPKTTKSKYHGNRVDWDGAGIRQIRKCKTVDQVLAVMVSMAAGGQHKYMADGLTLDRACGLYKVNRKKIAKAVTESVPPAKKPADLQSSAKKKKAPKKGKRK